jgi:hypothetical protein
MTAGCSCVLFLGIRAAWCFTPTLLIPAPALTYSTYLREGFEPNAVATDAAGNVYLAGTVILDPLNSQAASMIVKLEANGTRYVYARTLGGASSDRATAIAVDKTGNAYVVGSATSPDPPVTAGRQLGTPPARPTRVLSWSSSTRKAPFYSPNFSEGRFTTSDRQSR